MSLKICYKLQIIEYIAACNLCKKLTFLMLKSLGWCTAKDNYIFYATLADINHFMYSCGLF